MEGGGYDGEVDLDYEMMVWCPGILPVCFLDDGRDVPSGVEYGTVVEERDVTPRYYLLLSLCTAVSDGLLR